MKISEGRVKDSLSKMKCVIPGPNVKVFGRAVHTLSKIGEELYIEALEHGLALRTVNSSRSAYACFTFAPSFFLQYSDVVDDVASNSSEDEVLKYKINMKSCLTVFKSLSTLEKTVDKCRIHLDLKECRLVFQMYCRHGIVKTHNLAFIECETLQAVFDKETNKNVLTAQTKLLCEAVLNFQTTQEEVTLILNSERMHLKNYVDDQSDPHKVIHTELTLEPDEFESYSVGADCQVTFCLKELRAILAFSEPANLPVSIYFNTAGKPIVFSMETDPSFEGNFVLATLADRNAEVNSSQSNSQLTASQHINDKTVQSHRSATRVNHKRMSTEMATTSRHVGDSDGLPHHKDKPSSSKPSNSNRAVNRPSTSSHMQAACEEICNDQPMHETMDTELNTTSTASKLNSTHNNNNNKDNPELHEYISNRHQVNRANSTTTREKDLSTRSNVSLGLPERPRLMVARPGADVDKGDEEEDDDDDMACSPIIPFQGPRQKAPNASISRLIIPSDDSTTDDERDGDAVPGTPPAKKFKSIFAGLSQSTVGGGSQSTQRKVLVADTDSEED